MNVAELRDYIFSHNWALFLFIVFWVGVGALFQMIPNGERGDAHKAKAE